MYRELVTGYLKDNEFINIQPPCPEDKITEAEKASGLVFPDDLKDLLREMDGDKWLLFSAQEIVDTNRSVREDFCTLFTEDSDIGQYRTRIDSFLFFATNGCGDYYCYRICEDGTADPGTVYIWNHEDIGEECCWKKVADSLKECIVRYYDGEI